MRRLLRHTWLPLYRLWALRHIRRGRVFRYAGLRIEVPPGVFHPGVFFSTPVFLSYLQEIDFQDKTTLDMGTGSGALALFAARKGARTTATDINPAAVETARLNARENGLDIRVIESDLFDQVPPQAFDIVLINPPYYPRQPRDDAEKAFFAGENLEYFDKLFRQLGGFVHAGTSVLMILSEDCDMPRINKSAAQAGYALSRVFGRKKWGEQFWVFSLHPVQIAPEN